jgi:uroporphyrin-III C-methyltransferase
VPIVLETLTNLISTLWTQKRPTILTGGALLCPTILAMKDATSDPSSPVPLMAAWHTESQVHLIIGSNPLAAARCAKSLEVGAKPIILAPETADMHFTLSEHIASGSAQWIRHGFQDTDLTTLGKEEVDHVVDLVFVTLGVSNPLSMRFSYLNQDILTDIP